ncbi:hypothetical protein NSA56_09920 [Oceanobacillus caeni]|uniref:Uncharacterized protein n=1 Tax=Oceanobacillus caeni TaxID=405946 RepID=A0ABR5MGJ9_9BACI|nr:MULTISPECIES: hypothetical protein [Bacillaceae]KKE80394.1 hypothetical protein WH51_02070 [Bacilli bacterium VT-13-104]PZD83390.1 hypothetical protein DEJ64_14980 [Bacilli bacterium]KPH71749.1 hypothetical protein AFL42_14310 [Oceanobacillus caeni]MBU8792404.1 hypothetical protein [Oceanobacillus caeni]MCR1834715.1 hypothetical protein [Oceanobacillus caeni]
MKWQEAREIFPDQFLLVSILDYHFEDDKAIIDEVVPIRPINFEDANKELSNAKDGTTVYHTVNKNFVLHRWKPVRKLRRIK